MQRVFHLDSWLPVNRKNDHRECLSLAVIIMAYLLGGLLYPSTQCLQRTYFSKVASAPAIL